MSGLHTLPALRTPAFLAGDGEMACLVRGLAGSSTPLGPPDRWPQALRTALRLMLNTGQPMCVLWGPQALCLYNDAFRRSIGPEGHPASLGRPAREGWAGMWPTIGPQVDEVMSGRGAAWHERERMPVARQGRPADVWWTYGLSPIDDDSAPGGVGGVLLVCDDVTPQVLLERRQALLLDVAAAMRGPDAPLAMLASATRLIGERLGVAQVGWGEVDEERARFNVQQDWNDGRIGSVRGRWRIEDFGAGFASELKAGRTVRIDDVTNDARTRDPDAIAAFAGAGIGAVLDVPMVRAGRLVAILFLHQPGPHRWSDDEVALVEETSARLWGEIDRARAHAERDRLLAELRAGEARLRAIADNLPDSVVYRHARDPDGTPRFLHLSAGVERLTGVSADEALRDAWRLRGLVLPESRAALAAAEARCAETGADFEIEVPMRCREGELRWMRLSSHPTRLPDGRLVWDGVMTDVTARRLVEDEWRRALDRARGAQSALAEADARKDEFLAMLAHELRNPLAPLVNALRLIERGERLGERGRVAIDMANRQTAQLQRLVDDLLEVSRITRGKIELRREPLPLRTVVQRAVESAGAECAARGHALAVDAPVPSPVVDADPVRVSQILDNLLGNAAKYTPDGGHIVVSVRTVADAAEIRVTDDGIGIAPDVLPTLFEPFRQVDASLDRSKGGLGIGLALVRMLAELHGGSAHAESAGPGRGSSFVVRLPLWRGTPPAADPPPG